MVVWQVNPLMLLGFNMLKTITQGVMVERITQDKTLLRGNELIRGNEDPYHVLRLFTKLLPNVQTSRRLP